MEANVVSYFTKDTTGTCGIEEAVTLQLKEKNKGVGVFNANAFVFEAHDTDDDHIGIINKLSDSIGGAHYIICVSKISETTIEVNMLSHMDKPKDYILSDFERLIFDKINYECNMAEKLLPKELCFRNGAFSFTFDEDAKSTALEVAIETEKAKEKSNESFFSRLFRRLAG